MLILEAKVRDGYKPVLFLNDKASPKEIADAMDALFRAIGERLQRRGDDALADFLSLIE